MKLSSTLAVLALVGLTTASWRSLSGDETSGDPGARELLNQIEKIFDRLERNQKKQARAWPRREEDQLEELPPPPAVQELAERARGLMGQREVLFLQLKRKMGIFDSKIVLPEAVSSDVQPLLDFLKRSKSREQVVFLVPLLERQGTEGDPATLRTLTMLVQRFKPAPREVLEILVDSRDAAAAKELLEIGLERGDASILEAAGRTGDLEVLDRLVTLADGIRLEEDSVVLRALQDIVPHPETLQASRVSRWARERMGNVSTDEVKSWLLLYVGRLGQENDVGFLGEYLSESTPTTLRTAALQALANGGEPAGRELLEVFRGDDLTVEERRACLHSISVTGLRDAVPVLIPWLGIEELKYETKRALKRLTGKDFGFRVGAWARWWRRSNQA